MAVVTITTTDADDGGVYILMEADPAIPSDFAPGGDAYSIGLVMLDAVADPRDVVKFNGEEV